MKYYLEITLIDSEDESLYFIWSKLYAQLHLALVEVKKHNDKSNIGVSFPEYRFNPEKGIGFLGTKLRVFANSEEELQTLNIVTWLARLSDYIHITSIREVPVHKITGYAIFSRKQVKTNASRLARHRIKRGDINFDEAVARYQNIVTRSDLPFIQLNSLTNKHQFRLFIQKANQSEMCSGTFTSYGLSYGATVPEF
ncbi:MAG: type I-F CRISPR-associated endoribonuclease Cas6/Csy4 [Proteobacteria bacterium]|nr:MAG: type I-F CRISPR-associated endoribonuclease Cas6/Csy4 [Pseudomonadota bacterium]